MVKEKSFRVLVVVPGFPGEDDGWFIPGVSEVVAELASRAEVQVVSLFHPQKKGKTTWRKIPVHSCGLTRGGVLRWIWAGWQGERFARKVAKDFQPDHILSFWATEPATVARGLAGKLQIPWSLYLAGGELVFRPDIPYGDARHPNRRVRILSAVRSAEHVFVGSRIQEAIGLIGGGVPRGRLHCIPLGFAEDRFQEIPENNPGEPDALRVLTVADLLPVKGHALQVQALGLIPEEEVHLRWVGMVDPSTQLQSTVKMMGEQDRVTFAGPVHHTEIAGELAATDVFLQTSCWESQGIALLEAMACGVPVITSSAGIAPEALKLAGCGVLLKTRDPQELSDALQHMKQNLPAETQAAREGAARIREAYGAGGAADRILRVLKGE